MAYDSGHRWQLLEYGSLCTRCGRLLGLSAGTHCPAVFRKQRA